MILAAYLNSHFTLAQYLDFFTRILAAAACGFCIGLERSRRMKEAGVRTHVIVCCAAALMMIVSKYGFADLTSMAGAAYDGTRGADPARVAAQVVSGISFLGAGVIFKHGDTVKGLTTAAIIWATAGIGLAMGAGMYVMGVFTTITIIILQILMHHLPFGMDTRLFRLEFTVRDDKAFREQFAAYARKSHILIVRNQFSHLENGAVRYNTTMRIPNRLPLHEAEAFFHDNAEVESVEFAIML